MTLDLSLRCDGLVPEGPGTLVGDVACRQGFIAAWAPLPAAFDCFVAGDLELQCGSLVESGSILGLRAERFHVRGC